MYQKYIQPEEYIKGFCAKCVELGVDPGDLLKASGALNITEADFEKAAANFEKQAIAPALLFSLPFALGSGVGAAKNLWGAAKDFGKGEWKSGLKNLGYGGLQGVFSALMLGMGRKPMMDAAKALKAKGGAQALGEVFRTTRAQDWAKSLGGKTQNKVLSKILSGVGTAAGKPLDLISKGEKAIFGAAGKYMPGTSELAAKGLDKLTASPLMSNRITRYFKRHPMQEMGMWFGAEPLMGATIGANPLHAAGGAHAAVQQQMPGRR